MALQHLTWLFYINILTGVLNVLVIPLNKIFGIIILPFLSILPYSPEGPCHMIYQSISYYLCRTSPKDGCKTRITDSARKVSSLCLGSPPPPQWIWANLERCLNCMYIYLGLMSSWLHWQQYGLQNTNPFFDVFLLSSLWDLVIYSEL